MISIRPALPQTSRQNFGSEKQKVSFGTKFSPKLTQLIQAHQNTLSTKDKEGILKLMNDGRDYVTISYDEGWTTNNHYDAIRLYTLTVSSTKHNLEDVPISIDAYGTGNKFNVERNVESQLLPILGEASVADRCSDRALDEIQANRQRQAAENAKRYQEEQARIASVLICK